MPTIKELDAAAGIAAAGRAIEHLAAGDEQGALAVLNSRSHGELLFACSYLLSAAREAVSVSVRHDPKRLEVALRRAASGAAQDAVVTVAGVIAEEASHE